MKAGDDIADSAGRIWTVIGFEIRDQKLILEALSNAGVLIGDRVVAPCIAAILEFKGERKLQ